MLGPWLYVVYINTLDENVQCKISKFTDDIEVGGISYSEVVIKITAVF